MMKLKRLVALLICLLLALGFQSVTAQNRRKANAAASQARLAAENISERQLEAYLSFITAGELEGRDTPSKGLDLTAKFIATNLSTWGLKPAGENDSFFQKITLRRESIDPARTRAEINGTPYHYGADFISPGLASGAAAGPLIYVGHGWVHGGKNINAYEGADVRDKIMVVAGGGYPPDAITFQDTLRSGGWEHPYGYAQKHGARGVIFLPHFRTLGEWDAHERRTLLSGRISLGGAQRPRTAPGFYEGAYHRLEIGTSCCGLEIPAITASVGMLRSLLSGEKVSAGTLITGRAPSGEQIKAFQFDPGKQVSFTVALTADVAYGQNVLAVFEGSDPVLKHEYVAIGAHYDTVGGDGPRYGGADDNGSGTVGVMAIAKAFAAAGHPRRSVLFTWYAGEEKGLWGSRHFVEHPTVPLDRIVAYINLDMIGRSKNAADSTSENADLTSPNEVYVLGPKLTSTELGELSERVNRSYLNLRLNYKYDDPNAPDRLFRRSDNFPYAQKGVPIIYYFTGFHADYHSPSDTSEKIDYRKIEKVVRTAFLTAWELANSASRPRFDKPLPK
jgi:hypothetical protein